MSLKTYAARVGRLMTVTLFLVGCQTAATSMPTAPPPTPAPAQVASPAPDETEANIAVVRRFYDEFNRGNVDVILEVHPASLLMHYAGTAEEVPAQVLRDDLAAVKAANPDLHAEIHSLFGHGDVVVAELTWTTTHTGDYFGIPATGQTTTHPGIVVRRLENGKIVESWEMWDDLAFLNSIGYLPTWDEIIAAKAVDAAEAELPPLSADQALVGTASELAGIWRGRAGSPGDPPESFWWFKPDGTYQIAYTVEQLREGFAVERGTYSVQEGRLVLHATAAGCADDVAEATGTYQVRLARTADGQPYRLQLLSLSDECTPRKNGTQGFMPFLTEAP
jgi:steroid delta-isomerase-like uncharacterized protein